MIDRYKRTIEQNAEDAPQDKNLDLLIRELLLQALKQFLKWLSEIGELPCSFQEFLVKTGEDLAKNIALVEERDNLMYVGGKSEFKLVGKYVEMRVKLYFWDKDKEDKLDADGEWKLQDIPTVSIKKSRFNDWDTDEDLQRLSRGETVELNIKPPQD